MLLFQTIKELRQHLDNKHPQSIALVPTMGNLHAGHLQLVKIAKTYADIVVVSIFVNPTQFGANEDFGTYPRTLQADLTALDGLADIVFAPSVAEMYPTYPPATTFVLGDISGILCGKSRPTHFDGVALVVSKLFNIIRPNVAVFGKKDYQQLAIIRQINSELNFDINIIGVDIVRADDGLALSSRNQYLSTSERALAPQLYAHLKQLATNIRAMDTANTVAILALVEQTKAQLNHIDGFNVDYLAIYNQDLSPISDTSCAMVIAAAVWVGQARLLDNITVNIGEQS